MSQIISIVRRYFPLFNSSFRFYMMFLYESGTFNRMRVFVSISSTCTYIFFRFPICGLIFVIQILLLRHLVFILLVYCVVSSWKPLWLDQILLIDSNTLAFYLHTYWLFLFLLQKYENRPCLLGKVKVNCKISC